jgi:hypothetical protein
MLKSRSQKGEKTSRTTAIERRAWVRFTSTLEASCQSKGALKDAGWPGKVVDLSLGGVGLILRHRFPSGTPLTVELKTESGRSPGSVSVRVIHTRPMVIEGDPCWFTGCAFAQNLTERELQELLAESD